MTFTYTHTKIDGINVFKLEGEILDKTQVAELVEQINKLLAAGKKHFILELSGLSYMNSIGLNVFVNLLTKARNAGGDLAVCNLSKKASELMVVTKLDTIFHILPTVEEAVEKLKSKT